MDKANFKKQMDRIVSVFGSEDYSAERVKLIYREVQDLTDREFESVVDHLIATIRRRFPPLVPEFREAAYNKKQKRLDFETKGASKSLNERKGLEEILQKNQAKDLNELLKKIKKARP